MKKNIPSTISNRTAEFVYSSLLDEIIVNDVYPKFDLKWEACNYRESHLSAIKERDYSLEFRLRLVNSLMMEYHTHRYWKSYANGWFLEYSYLYDEDPEKSKAVLLRAMDYIELVLENKFKGGKKLHRDYFILSVSLMYEIIRELKNYGIHRNPLKLLQTLR